MSENTMTKKHSAKSICIVFIGFWILFLLLMSMERPVHEVLCSESLSTWGFTRTDYKEGKVHKSLCSKYISAGNLKNADPLRRPKSEYRVDEQLSKFYLFIMILISLYSYQFVHDSGKAKIGICFFVLGLTMYLSESNMITTHTQPLFAFIILSFTFYFLIQNKSWLTIFILLFGLLSIFGGYMLDLIYDGRIHKLLVPSQLSLILKNIGEERFELIGIAATCLSAMIYFLNPMKKFAKNNMKGILSLIISSGLIAVGNGYLHFQYEPGRKLQLFGFFLSASGWLGLILTNKILREKDALLKLVPKDVYYVVMFVLFVLLPTIYGESNRDLISIILWLPTIVLFAVYLTRRHPALS